MQKIFIQIIATTLLLIIVNEIMETIFSKVTLNSSKATNHNFIQGRQYGFRKKKKRFTADFLTPVIHSRNKSLNFMNLTYSASTSSQKLFIRWHTALVCKLPSFGLQKFRIRCKVSSIIDKSLLLLMASVQPLIQSMLESFKDLYLPPILSPSIY